MVIGIDITVLNSVIANLQIPFAMKNLGQLHYLELRPILIRHLVPVPIQICSGSFVEGFYVGRIASWLPPCSEGLSLQDGQSLQDVTQYRSLVVPFSMYPSLVLTSLLSIESVSLCTGQHHSLADCETRLALFYRVHLSISADYTVIQFWSHRDPDDKWSTSGLCIFLWLNLISWIAKEQATVFRFSIAL